MSGDGQLKAPVLERGLYRWLRGWLAHPAADQVIMWLGFVLLLPSLPTGLAADDYVHTAMLDRPAPIAGFARAPLDIFRFDFISKLRKTRLRRAVDIEEPDALAKHVQPMLHIRGIQRLARHHHALQRFEVIAVQLLIQQ